MLQLFLDDCVREPEGEGWEASARTKFSNAIKTERKYHTRVKRSIGKSQELFRKEESAYREGNQPPNDVRKTDLGAHCQERHSCDEQMNIAGKNIEFLSCEGLNKW